MGLFGGRAENCNSGHASYNKTIGKSGEQEECSFREERAKLGALVINKTSLGINCELEV